MSYLAYQEALDTHHAVFRLIRIHLAIGSKTKIFTDHWRILDFFLLFPFRMERIQLKSTHRRFRKALQSFSEDRPYERQPDDIILLRRMEVVQRTAVQTLAHYGYLDGKLLEDDRIAFTDKALPSDIVERARDRNESASALMQIIEALGTEYAFGGDDGIKKRSGLLEYRYDAA